MGFRKAGKLSTYNMPSTAGQFVSSYPLHTAVLFLVFNRPEATAKVFEAIREARPPKLYVAADGARGDRDGEVDRCSRVREIGTSVDWPCEVHTLFREKNLGCRIAVSSAISWFFEHEEEGIILEDDCLPEQSFFWFCEELLRQYRGNDKILQISGNNFSYQGVKGAAENSSYMAAPFAQIWGWATWARAWKLFSLNLTDWRKNDLKKLKYRFPNRFSFWIKAQDFDKVASDQLDTWDFQWQYAVLSNNGLAIYPAVNLVSNIGYGNEATHTNTFDSLRNNLKSEDICFPLNHPAQIEINERFTKYLTTRMGMGLSFSNFVWLLRQIVSRN